MKMYEYELVVEWGGLGLRPWLLLTCSVFCKIYLAMSCQDPVLSPYPKAVWELPTDFSPTDIPKGLCKEASCSSFPKSIYFFKKKVDGRPAIPISANI